jgi:hypothetical protein
LQSYDGQDRNDDCPPYNTDEKQSRLPEMFILMRASHLWSSWFPDNAIGKKRRLNYENEPKNNKPNTNVAIWLLNG